MRRREIGRERGGTAEAFGGLFEAAELLQRRAAIAPFIHGVRLDGERAIVALHRLLAPAERHERVGAVAVQAGARRAERERAIEARQRFRVAAEMRQRLAVQGVDAGLIRRQRKRLLEDGDALPHPALLAGRKRVAIERIGGVRHRKTQSLLARSISSRSARQRSP